MVAVESVTATGVIVVIAPIQRREVVVVAVIDALEGKYRPLVIAFVDTGPW